MGKSYVPWAYAGGGIIRTLMMTSVLVFWNSFLIQVAKIDADKVGVLMFFVKILDAVNDPIVGYYSDNLVLKRDKRQKQMIISLLPMSVLFIFLWWVPHGTEDQLIVYYLAIAFFFDIFMSFYDINYDALISEMTVRYTDRVPMVFKKNLVGTTSILVAITVQAAYVEGHDQSKEYITYACLIVASGMPFALLCVHLCRGRRGDATIWEDYEKHVVLSSVDNSNVDRMDDSGPERVVMQQSLPRESSFVFFVRRMIYDYRGILGDKNYMLLTLANTSIVAMINVMIMMLKLYIVNVLHADFTLVIMRLQLGLLVGLILYAALFYFNLAIDKRNTLLGTLALLMVSVITFAVHPHADPAQVFIGIFISGTTIIMQSMLPDVIDVSQSLHPTLSRRDGSYYGLFSVMNKLATAVAISASDVILGLLGFEDNGGGENAAKYLKWLYAILPPMLILAAMIFTWFYDITIDRQQKALSVIIENASKTVDSDDEDDVIMEFFNPEMAKQKEHQTEEITGSNDDNNNNNNNNKIKIAEGAIDL